MVDCQLDILDYDLPEKDGYSIVFVVNTLWCQGHRIWRKKGPPPHKTNFPEIWKKESFLDHLHSGPKEIPMFIEMWYTDSSVDNLQHKGDKEHLVGVAKINVLKLILHITPNPAMEHFDVFDVENMNRKIGRIYVRLNFKLWPDLAKQLWGVQHPYLHATAPIDEVDKPDECLQTKIFDESTDSPLQFGTYSRRPAIPEKLSGRSTPTEKPQLISRTTSRAQLKRDYSFPGIPPGSPLTPKNDDNSPKSSHTFTGHKRTLSEVSPIRHFISLSPTNELANSEPGSSASKLKKSSAEPSIVVRSNRIAANIYNGKVDGGN